PFQAEALPAGEGVMGAVWRWLPPIATRLLGVVFAAFMLLNVVRPMILALGTPAGAEGGTGRIEGPAGAMLAITKENQSRTQDKPGRAGALIGEGLLGGRGGRSEGGGMADAALVPRPPLAAALLGEGVDKAATFLLTVGQDAANEIFRHLGEAE